MSAIHLDECGEVACGVELTSQQFASTTTDDPAAATCQWCHYAVKLRAEHRRRIQRALHFTCSAVRRAGQQLDWPIDGFVAKSRPIAEVMELGVDFDTALNAVEHAALLGAWPQVNNQGGFTGDDLSIGLSYRYDGPEPDGLDLLLLLKPLRIQTAQPEGGAR